MSTEVALTGGSFEELAAAMGMSADMEEKKGGGMMFPRLRIFGQSVMGVAEVKGKKVNVETIPAGCYRLEQGDSYVYAEEVRIRTFLQRFMYKRWDSANKEFIKTVMGEDIRNDLKDDHGTFNAGRASGFIEDWNALPKDTQDLIKACKRTRVLMGEVEMINPVDENGDPVTVPVSPFIWEETSKNGWNTLAAPFNEMGRMRRLPLQHWITCGSDSAEMANGNSFFWPVCSVDTATTIEITEDDQAKFQNFVDFVANYNKYIVEKHDEARKGDNPPEDEMSLVEDFIDLEDVEEVDGED